MTEPYDRYANQGLSHSLQRLEDFTGIVFLASNLEGDMDDAFAGFGNRASK